MPPRSTRRRALALGLELLGVAAVVYAVAAWNLAAAIGLGGALLVIAAQFLHELV